MKEVHPQQLIPVLSPHISLETLDAQLSSNQIGLLTRLDGQSSISTLSTLLAMPLVLCITEVKTLVARGIVELKRRKPHTLIPPAPLTWRQSVSLLERLQHAYQHSIPNPWKTLIDAGPSQESQLFAGSSREPLFFEDTSQEPLPRNEENTSLGNEENTSLDFNVPPTTPETPSPGAQTPLPSWEVEPPSWEAEPHSLEVEPPSWEAEPPSPSFEVRPTPPKPFSFPPSTMENAHLFHTLAGPTLEPEFAHDLDPVGSSSAEPAPLSRQQKTAPPPHEEKETLPEVPNLHSATTIDSFERSASARRRERLQVPSRSALSPYTNVADCDSNDGEPLPDLSNAPETESSPEWHPLSRKPSDSLDATNPEIPPIPKEWRLPKTTKK